MFIGSTLNNKVHRQHQSPVALTPVPFGVVPQSDLDMAAEKRKM
jgi:hypothetical protein